MAALHPLNIVCLVTALCCVVFVSLSAREQYDLPSLLCFAQTLLSCFPTKQQYWYSGLLKILDDKACTALILTLGSLVH